MGENVQKDINISFQYLSTNNQVPVSSPYDVQSIVNIFISETHV